MAMILFALAPLGVLAAPSADLWERWIPSPQPGVEAPDHARWDGFLKRHLVAGPDGVNRVDYEAAGGGGRAELDAYVAHLAAIRPTALSRAEAKAYWINLYNALTVRVVLDHYPVDSIRDIDISPGLFANGPWGAELIEVEGVALTLDDIEHRIIRPIWRDPRIHYAVNCAAIGCPELQAEAFQAAALDDQLDRAARAFVNHPRGANLSGGGLRVSSIYDWFMEDFGDTDAEVIAHIRRYADAELAARLRFVTEIDGDDYDWRINSTRTGG